MYIENYRTVWAPLCFGPMHALDLLFSRVQGGGMILNSHNSLIMTDGVMSALQQAWWMVPVASNRTLI